MTRLAYSVHQGDRWKWKKKRKNLYRRHDRTENIGYRLGHKYSFRFPPPYLEKYPVLQGHTYAGCDFQGWKNNSKGDQAHFGIMDEEDLFNPDDKVAKWRFVPTNDAPLDLCHKKKCKYRYTKSGWQAHADMTFWVYKDRSDH